MAIRVDTEKALRRPSDIEALLDAIFCADSHDELAWVEWKRSLDLLTPKGRFGIAKAILGIANRMPDAARSVCQGLGYVVVGLEPGEATGITPIDPAQLDDGLAPYLGGAKGPSWSPTFTNYQGVAVLVVVVEAPQWGDPIHTLRKGFNDQMPGTVFVRRPGKTIQADADEMDLLQERVRAGSASSLDLDMTFVGDVPASWFDPSLLDDTIDEWVGARRDRLVDAARKTDRIKSGEDAAAAPGLEGLRLGTRFHFDPFTEEDTRSLDEYIGVVDKWAEGLRSAVKSDGGLLAHYLEQGYGIVRLRAENQTDRYFSNVLVKAHLPGDDVVGFDERPWPDRLPRPPRAYGEPKRLTLDSPLMSIPRNMDFPYSPPAVDLRTTWVEDGSVRVVWDLGDLRPRDSEESDDIYVFVNSGSGSIHGRWEATSKSVDGVVTGDIALHVAEEPVDISRLLDLAYDAE